MSVKKTAGMLLKGAVIVGGVLACLLALGLGAFYMSVRPKELPLETARQYIQLEPGDEVLHAYTGARWLDSQRYFVVKADPAGFDARIKKISETHSSPAGTSPIWRVVVREGPGKDLWFRTERTPSWWDVDTLPSAVAVDVGSTGHNHSGSLSLFSKDRGLIYVLDR